MRRSSVVKNKQLLLANRPVGMVSAQDFTVAKTPVPEPLAGQFVVQNIYLSLDPAMRVWMRDVPSYLPPVQLGDVMRGMTVGIIEHSNSNKFSKGDLVLGMGQWQEYCIGDDTDKNWQKLVEIEGIPISAYLSVLGPTGLTAYFGLLDIGEPKPGETVLVSGAAGAVGSIVGQIAKIKGCRVVGIAGSDEKCRYLVEELGFDEAINYKEVVNWKKTLKDSCPNGIDIYFDNVGGDILNAALTRINLFSRIVLCGAISTYNSIELPTGPSNYSNLISKRGKMEGFIILDYVKQWRSGIMELATWINQGLLKFDEEIKEGLENAPEYLNLLFTGNKKGKLIVQIGELETQPKL
eukprot:TRINITY_DN10549_c0_g1_i1.p1 TRINITY_DN10549_c0_g1~~TRINITY_DN10549_c0_g1_i1.p1  ORF type:complete len:351 (-),score=85.15 TRINITY_DN10549_c0_g1_i1:71-1123(-)